jgi:hypothetical protein
MTSAVTNSLNRLLFDLLKEDIDSESPGYYVGLTRSETFTDPASISSPRFQAQARHSLQSVKRIAGSSFVVPNVTWASGEIYNQYVDDNPNQINFYVMNSLREVFVCVEQAKINGIAQESTVEPIASASAVTFATTDGYKWRYLYKLSNLAYANFKTNSYIPVKQIINLTSIPEELEQYNLQNDSSVSGELLGIYIDSGGSEYSTTPSLIISGNGTGAAFTPELYNGKIVNVKVDSDGSGVYNHGIDYDYASITVDSGGGSGAVLRPIFAPKFGTSFDPVETLKSNSIMIRAQVDGTETDTILAENNFYQVVLLRNLKKYGVDSDFTANSGNALKSLTVSSVSGTFYEDATFSNNSGSVEAKVFVLDSDKLYYYQNEDTGFEVFTSGDTLISGAATASITAINNPDVDAYSGEILYINNVSAGIPRETSQTEDIRIVISLG